MMIDHADDHAVDTDMIQLDFWEIELLDEVRELLSRQPTEDIRPQLLDAVNQLFTLLPLQFDAKACEEQYLQEVLDEFPNWHGQVKALQIQQAFLYEDLRDIRDQLRDNAPLKGLIADMGEWLERLHKHEVEEQRLSQLAINLDLGGSGD